MTWSTPLLAGIVAAIAIPSLVILYFLKLRRKEAHVSTTLLWKQAIQDMQANAPFQRLRRNILLLLQLLALGAALFAIAQPEQRAESAAGGLSVIMIDRSASMASLDGDDRGATRLDAAKKAAIDEIDKLADGGVLSGGQADRAMVIAFDTTAEVMARFTTDKRELRDAIESIKQTDVPGEIDEAFQLAQAHRPEGRVAVFNPTPGEETPQSTGETMGAAGLVGGPPQTFMLFSDGRLPDLEVLAPRSDDSVEFFGIGTEDAGNVAITGLRAERAYDNPARLSVFVALQNAAGVPWPVDVELALDGTPQAIRSVTLPAAEEGAAVVETADPDTGAVAAGIKPGAGGVVFTLEMSRGAVARVRVRGDSTATTGEIPTDVLPTDDEGLLVIQPAKQSSVAVVTADDLFLVDALGALPLAELRRYTPAEYAAAPASERSAFDVTVLDGLLPPDIPEGRGLPPGRWLILGAGPTSPEAVIDNGAVAEELLPTRFLDWSRDHPILRDLTLAPVRVGAMRRLEVPPESSAEVIADTPEGPGIVEINASDYRAIVTSFRPFESNWFLDVGFVVFLAEAVQELDAASRGAGDAPDRQLAPGDVLVDRLPPSAGSPRITGPGGESTPLSLAPDGSFSFGPLDTVGLYRIEYTGDPAAGDRQTQGGRSIRRYAVNLLDPPESIVARSTGVELADRIVQASGVESQQSIRRFWPYLMVTVLAIMMFEWWIYNRRVAI